MSVLKPGEIKIASESDLRAGTIGFFGINDAFDLFLVKLKSGSYKLIVFMKIQFFFEDGDGGKWSLVDKNTFVNRWKMAIQGKWGNRTIKSLSGAKKVNIDFRFQTQIEGWMFDHWEITVEKVKKFAVSSVNPITGNVLLDSLDLKLTLKKGGKRQRGVIHEFGHMLGLADEYPKKSPHHADYRSVMNSGEAILRRHDSPFMKWLNNALAKHGIK